MTDSVASNYRVVVVSAIAGIIGWELGHWLMRLAGWV